MFGELNWNYNDTLRWYSIGLKCWIQLRVISHHIFKCNGAKKKRCSIEKWNTEQNGRGEMRFWFSFWFSFFLVFFLSFICVAEVRLEHLASLSPFQKCTIILFSFIFQCSNRAHCQSNIAFARIVSECRKISVFQKNIFAESNEYNMCLSVQPNKHQKVIMKECKSRKEEKTIFHCDLSVTFYSFFFIQSPYSEWKKTHNSCFWLWWL